MKAADLNLRLIGCCLTMAMIARPGLAANALNGEKLARRWCEPCHVVAADQRGVAGAAPPFSSIATRPGFDAARICNIPPRSHPKMPDMSLSRGGRSCRFHRQIGAVAAKGLRREGQTPVFVRLLGLYLISRRPPAVAGDAAVVKRGEVLLARRHCSRLPRNRQLGRKPAPASPLFRAPGKHYQIEFPEEALGQGIISGRPDMREFKFAPADVGA